VEKEEDTSDKANHMGNGQEWKGEAGYEEKSEAGSGIFCG
jgi:hypothetical protein